MLEPLQSFIFTVCALIFSLTGLLPAYLSSNSLLRDIYDPISEFILDAYSNLENITGIGFIRNVLVWFIFGAMLYAAAWTAIKLIKNDWEEVRGVIFFKNTQKSSFTLSMFGRIMIQISALAGLVLLLFSLAPQSRIWSSIGSSSFDNANSLEVVIIVIIRFLTIYLALYLATILFRLLLLKKRVW